MSSARRASVIAFMCAICFTPVLPSTFLEEPTDYVDDVVNGLDELVIEREVLETKIPEMWDVPENSPAIVALASREPLPRDCADLYDQGLRASRDYTIYVGRKQRPLKVYCDQTTDGGGWTVFQRRFNGYTNYHLPWNYYANGFGSVTDEYWLGLNNIHLLTLHDTYTLRVDMTDFSSVRRYAEYTNFKIGSSCQKYKLLSLGDYCGTAGDSLTYHVGSRFSTLDQDNDNSKTHCAADLKGAWWYNNCHHSNLNGIYLRSQQGLEGMTWQTFHHVRYSLKTSEMKIRPTGFNL